MKVKRRYEGDKSVQGRKKRRKKREKGVTMYQLRRLRILHPSVGVLVFLSQCDLNSETIPSRGLR